MTYLLLIISSYHLPSCSTHTMIRPVSSTDVRRWNGAFQATATTAVNTRSTVKSRAMAAAALVVGVGPPELQHKHARAMLQGPLPAQLGRLL